MNNIKPLIEKLSKAKFTGVLELRFEVGHIASAELRHYLAKTEFKERELVTLEAENEFSLKP
jgi:hypothetical protein